MYAKDVKEIIANVQSEGRGIAGYIAESLQSCGGQIIYPKNYFKHVFEAVRKAGGVCIIDEVQVCYDKIYEILISMTFIFNRLDLDVLARITGRLKLKMLFQT